MPRASLGFYITASGCTFHAGELRPIVTDLLCRGEEQNDKSPRRSHAIINLPNYVLGLKFRLETGAWKSLIQLLFRNVVSTETFKYRMNMGAWVLGDTLKDLLII